MNALNNDQNDSMDDFFRDRFQDFESDAGDFLWDQIEPQLPVTPVRRFIYWPWAAVAMLTMLIGAYMLSSDSIRKIVFLKNGADTPTLTTHEKGNTPVHTIRKIGGEGHQVEIAKKIQQQSQPLFKNGFDNKGIRYHASQAASRTQITKQITKQQENRTEFAYDKTSTPNAERIKTDNSGSDNGTTPFTESNKANATKLNALHVLESKPYQFLTSHFAKTKIRFKGPKPAVYYKIKQPVELYVSAMPLVNYYTITPNETDANYVHGITVNDGGRIGIYAQAGLRFSLSDRMKLRTGLSFSSSSQLISYQVRTDSIVSQASDSQATNVSFAEEAKEYKLKANYVGAKVDYQYILLKGPSITHHITLGIEGAINLNDTKMATSFVNIGYGLSRQIGDNVHFFVEPTWSYALFSQSDANALLLVKPNKIGFNLGLTVKL